MHTIQVFTKRSRLFENMYSVIGELFLQSSLNVASTDNVIWENCLQNCGRVKLFIPRIEVSFSFFGYVAAKAVFKSGREMR